MVGNLLKNASSRKLRLIMVAAGRALKKVDSAFIPACEEMEKLADDLPFNSSLIDRYFCPDWDLVTLTQWVLNDCPSADEIVKDILSQRLDSVCKVCDGKKKYFVTAASSDTGYSEWFDCWKCKGAGEIVPDWITPEVLSLARAAYDERERKCARCGGDGSLLKLEQVIEFTGKPVGFSLDVPCDVCSNGTIKDGTLDPARLAVLSDAIEEAGCPATIECSRCQGEMDPSCKYCLDGTEPHPLLFHLRNGRHYRGCQAIDLILGKG